MLPYSSCPVLWNWCSWTPESWPLSFWGTFQQSRPNEGSGSQLYGSEMGNMYLRETEGNDKFPNYFFECDSNTCDNFVPFASYSKMIKHRMDLPCRIRINDQCWIHTLGLLTPCERPGGIQCRKSFTQYVNSAHMNHLTSHHDINYTSKYAPWEFIAKHLDEGWASSLEIKSFGTK